MKKYEQNGGISVKLYAQKQLAGLTHYIDDATLRWHKSRVIYARPARAGHLFCLVTSDALDMDNTRRGFRYVVFDVSGHVIARPELEESYRTSAAAWDAGKKVCDAVNLSDVYAAITERATRAHEWELEEIKKLAEAVTHT